MRKGPEYNDVQKPACELLRDHFGYEYSSGESLSDELGSEAKVLLVDRLAQKLKDVNLLAKLGLPEASGKALTRVRGGRSGRGRDAAGGWTVPTQHGGATLCAAGCSPTAG